MSIYLATNSRLH